MSAASLLRLLESLESNEEHQLAVSEWAELCALAIPRAYAEPKKLPEPALVLTRQARVATYAGRHRRHQRLWCAGDLWRRQATDDTIQAGVTAEHEANGAPVVAQRLSARRAV